MPLNRKKKNHTKYIVWAIVILLLVLMIISFEPAPEFTEMVLYP